jgi:methionine biosynthesis protein MetW
MIELLSNSKEKPSSYYENTRKDMLKYIPPTVKCVLEVGCGNGNFSKLISEKYSAKCWGIEFNNKAAEEAVKVMHKVINADIINSLNEIPDSYFDCIILNDIIEHLVDPYSILKNLKSKLTSSGILVLSIPNVRYWRNVMRLTLFGEWNYTGYGILDSTHLRFFTYKSLKKMFPELGFEILALEGIEPNRTITSTFIQILNWLLLNNFVDTRYVDFACVIRPARGK